MSTQEVTEQQINPQEAGDGTVWSLQAISTLPYAWYKVRLGDVVDVKGGKRLPKGVGFAKEPTAYPYIRIVDFANGSVKTNGLKYLTAEVQQQISRYIIHKEDVYISIAGTIGIAGTIPNELDGANLTENAAKLVIRDRDELDKEYLANYLNGEGGQTQIENLTTKTTQPKLALTRIEQIRIPLPPPPQQRAIVKVLRTVQEAIQTRRDELKLEHERKASLMQYLFTHGTKGEPLKQTEIGEIPQSWQVMPLGDLLTNGILGGIQDGNHGEKHPKQNDFQAEGIPFITADCIRDGKVLYEKAKHLGSEWLGKLRIGFAKPGDVILTHKGTLGEVAIVGHEYEVIILSPQTTYYRVTNQDHLSPNYLAGAFASFAFKRQLEAIASTQSTRDYVGITVQKRIKIPLPSIDEQSEIAETFQACNSKIASLEKEISLHRELFRVILEELMTGRLLTLPLIAKRESHE